MKISPESSGLAERSEEISTVGFLRIGIYVFGLCECKLYLTFQKKKFLFLFFLQMALNG